MPAVGLADVVVEHEAGGQAIGCRKQGLDLLLDLTQRVGFCGAAVVVQTVQLFGERAGTGRITREEELNDVACDLHAAGGI